MKKHLSILLIILLCVSLMQPVLAAEEESAPALSFGESIDAAIEEKGESHEYTVTLSQCGRLKISMSAYMQYYCLYLLDEEGNRLWASEGNEWDASLGFRGDEYEIDLLPAAYTLKVTGGLYGNLFPSVGNYSLAADFTPAELTETEPNNSISEASPIMDGAAKGHIAINDRYDIYSFSLEEDANLHLGISSYMRYCSAYIYDGEGKQLWKADNKEWNAEECKRQDTYCIALEEGSYFLKISGYRYGNLLPSTGTYALSLGYDHAYEESIVEPECETEGYTEYLCPCGDSYIDKFVDAIGHNFGEWYEYDGMEERVCSICGLTEIRPIEVPHKHEYEGAIKAPDCTEGGYTLYVCQCGDSYEDEPTEALGHDFGQWSAAEDGTEERICSRCEEKETRPQHRHKYSCEIIKPGCLEGGCTLYKCECGDSYEEDPVEAIGHDEKVSVIKDASCLEAGEAKYSCVRCGEERIAPLPALEHEFEDDICLFCGNSAAYEKKVNINYRGIKIYLDGKEIVPCDGEGNTVEPFIMSSSGTTYLPLRAISQALGLNVQWNGDANTVKLTSGGEVKTGLGEVGKTLGEKSTYITYRNIRVYLDGTQLRLVNSLGVAVEPFILNSNSSVYLPLRIIGEALGLAVSWDGNTNSVYLRTTID